LHWFSDSRRCRVDRIDHAIFALARGRRTPSRSMEIRFATAATFPFLHDVQSVRISQFQSDQLENEEIDPALSRYFRCPRFYRDQLRMDAGDLVSRLLALWFSKAVAVAGMASRDRGRDRRRRIGRADRATLVRLAIELVGSRRLPTSNECRLVQASLTDARV